METGLTTPLPEGSGFLIYRERLMPFGDTRLTFSPKANTKSPAALRLAAALMSRSKSFEQEGQVHSRSFKVSASLMYPQQAQRLELGKKVSIATRLLLAQSAFYSSILRKCPQPASAMCLLTLGLRIRCLTLRDSTQTTWFSLISLRDNWWRLSIRPSEILA